MPDRPIRLGDEDADLNNIVAVVRPQYPLNPYFG